MRARAALAVLIVAPFVAAAEGTPPPAAEGTPPPAAERTGAAPEWTFGAGVSFDLFGLPAPSLLSGAFNASVPTVTASLERRLSARNWLVLGAAGGVTRNRMDVPAGGFGFSRDDARQLFVTAGVRRALTRPGRLAEVSAVFLAEAGLVDAEQQQVSFSSDIRQDLTSWLVGANAGIAVDRELTGGLSLRVASPLLGARYLRSRVTAPGQPERTGRSLSVAAILAPRLELRLAF